VFIALKLQHASTALKATELPHFIQQSSSTPALEQEPVTHRQCCLQSLM